MLKNNMVYGGVDLIIKPIIKSNISLRTHPLGCKENVRQQIGFVNNSEKYKGPKNVLIIGGSSGYGLASRISLAFGAGANTINVSYEAPPKGNKTGSAGWWNNIFFQQYAQKAGLEFKDFVGDAFSLEMKNSLVDYIKSTVGKIDLLVYSLASNRRVDPLSGELYTSTIKSTTGQLEGWTINIKDLTLKNQVMEEASEEEINNTIKVMGGEDWNLWIDTLSEAGVLADDFKTISYTYIGPEVTHSIYRNGTIGAAKKHLEKTCKEINEKLTQSCNGKAYISSSKAVVTKASAYIPMIPVYGSALSKVMKEMGIDEDCIRQKHRLFKDMVYGDNPVMDAEGRFRPDHFEMQEDVQKKVTEIMDSVTLDNFKEITDAEGFIKEFMQLNGFCFDGLDYEEDVDMEKLSLLTLK